MATRHFRAHQRFPLRVPIQVTAPGRGVSSRGTTMNLGIGGAACELDTPLRLGERVEVIVSEDASVRLLAEVAWVGWAESSAVRLGVRFESQDMERLSALLHALGLSTQVGA